MQRQTKESVKASFQFTQNKRKMRTPFEFDMPGRRASRGSNLLYYGMLISQFLTTGLGATLPTGTVL